MEIYSSCEMEDSVEAQFLQAVCDTPIACITGCVSSLTIQLGDLGLGLGLRPNPNPRPLGLIRSTRPGGERLLPSFISFNILSI